MNFGLGVPGVDASAVPDGAYLLDVREPVEWQAGHVPGAVHVPLRDLPARADEIPQDREIYVVCRVGARSAQAVNALNEAGWRATNVQDGMQGWAAAGRPLVNDGDDDPYIA